MSKKPLKPTKAPKKTPPRKTVKAKKAATKSMHPGKIKRKRPVPRKKPKRGRAAPADDVSFKAVEKLEELAAASSAKLHDIITTKKYGLYTRRSLRKMLQVDYIQDPDRRPLRELWEDDGRPYSEIPWNTIRDWSSKDGWEKQRKAYWRRVTQYALNRFMQEQAHSLMREIDRVSESLTYLEEYILPLKDASGKVRRYKKGDFKGLPMYPLEMPTQDKAVDMVLKLYKHRMSLVAAAAGKGADGKPLVEETMHDVPSVQLDPVAHSVDLSDAQLDAMSDALLNFAATPAPTNEEE